MPKRKASSSLVIVAGSGKLLLDEHGLPAAFDRRSLYRARKDVCRDTTGPYGALVHDAEVPLAGGGFQKVAFQNPFAFLRHNCQHSVHYAKIVQEAKQQHPGMWRLILYQESRLISILLFMSGGLGGGWEGR